MGTKKLISSATAKKGVNYVRSIVEADNCIFHEVHQENDYGNDAFIELVDNENVTGITVAVQIKSGKSFCSQNTCTISASKQHFEYWRSHSLPIIGIVYDPDEDKGYWCNIKHHIQDNIDVINYGPYAIKFKKTEFSSFTLDSFQKIFKPLHLKKQIELTLDEACRFIHSSDYTEHSFGLHTLMNKHANQATSWNTIFEIFRTRNLNELDKNIVYYLAHIPGHPDIFYTPEKTLSPQLKSSLKDAINNFSLTDVERILCLFDEDDEFDRGSFGQCAEAVISIVGDRKSKLLSIIKNTNLSPWSRDAAVVLFACYSDEAGAKTLRSVARKYPELQWPDELATHLQENGCFYPY